MLSGGLIGGFSLKIKVGAPMSLSSIAVKTAKSREKAYKLSDEKGLYLLINTNGSKYWKFKYRFGGKEKKLSLGVYPEVSLAEARTKRDDARDNLRKEIDPAALKKVKKQNKNLEARNSFKAIAYEWHAKFSPKWTPEHANRILRRLEQDIFPWLGTLPISEINAPDLLSALRRIESRGAIETAHRVHQNCGQIFRYAIASGYADRNPSADLQGALQTVKTNHFASITEPQKIGELLRAIHSYEGYYVTKCALQLAPLVFVRPGELRKAEWSEFNFELGEWRIPPQKMKMRVVHIVPLSTQAIKLLRELQALTGNGKYVFPSVRTAMRPMSENTINAGLRRLGYTKEEITGHGFRSMASTILNEQGWNRDAIERQLAHAERNNIRAAYNYAQYLPERKKMMQHWANFLDATIADSNVINFKIGI